MCRAARMPSTLALAGHRATHCYPNGVTRSVDLTSQAGYASFSPAQPTQQGKCIMRLPYETPKVTVAGSIKDLTQATAIGINTDNTFPLPHVTVHIPGFPPLHVPGSGGVPPGIGLS